VWPRNDCRTFVCQQYQVQYQYIPAHLTTVGVDAFHAKYRTVYLFIASYLLP